MFLNAFLNLISNIDFENPNFPPTILYSEGWLLRLIIDWFSTSGISDHTLSFPKDAHWFSEARLPSAFLPRFKGDPLAEAHTNADGVIGHITNGSKGKTDLALVPNATHFVVLEAKLYSGLSKGVKHAKYYDQAARSVACMADIIRQANHKPETFTKLGFYVLAPKVQISSRTFNRHLDKKSIRDKVTRRISSYDGERYDWLKVCFLPTLERIDVRTISWESILDTISENDSKIGESLNEYYSQCLTFNS